MYVGHNHPTEQSKIANYANRPK